MNILLVIDMQVDFVSGSLGTDEAKGIVADVVDRVNCAYQNGERVIFTRDTHFENYLNTQEGKLLPVKHCIKDTDGWKIIPELRKLSDRGTVIDKPTFGSISLGEMLFEASLTEKIDQITLIGLCTDICVISNAMIVKANLPEVPIFVESKCCAGVTPDSHSRALEAMSMCQICIV